MNRFRIRGERVAARAVLATCIVTAGVQATPAAAQRTLISRQPSMPLRDCLDEERPRHELTGVHLERYSSMSFPERTLVQATDAQWISFEPRILVFVGGGRGICWHGGFIAGQQPPSTPYPTMHDTYGMDAHAANFVLEHVHIFDTGDGVTMDEQGDVGWAWHDVYFKYMRDDCVENDFLNSGTIDDSFFDGCYSGFSARAYTGVLDGSHNAVTVRNSLFRMQKMDRGYLHDGVHGGFWKWGANSPQINLYNVVFYMDTNSVENDVTMPPPEKLWHCWGNVMIWEGPGPFPEPVPSCFTLLTGAAGVAYWNAAVAKWKAAHPELLRDVAPPIVSLWEPRASVTLTGVVELVATAVDDQDMGGVQFELDGQPIGAEVVVETEPTKWALRWDSRAASNGTHTLTAVARDAVGRTTTSAAVTITIQN